MKKFTDQRGLTLIELVVAVTIFSVILTVCVTVFTSVLKQNAREKVTLDLQREADGILGNMALNLKEAISIDTANSNFVTDPHVLSVNMETAGQTRRYQVTGGQLHYIDTAGIDTNLMSPGTTVTSLTFTPTSSAENKLLTVKIRGTITRSKGGQTVTFPLSSSVNTRPQ